MKHAFGAEVFEDGPAAPDWMKSQAVSLGGASRPQ